MEIQWPARLGQQNSLSAVCSKSSSSKAAGESKPEAYPRRYAGDFDELSTKLADFFSILLENFSELYHLPGKWANKQCVIFCADAISTATRRYGWRRLALPGSPRETGGTGGMGETRKESTLSTSRLSRKSRESRASGSSSLTLDEEGGGLCSS